MNRLTHWLLIYGEGRGLKKGTLAHVIFKKFYWNVFIYINYTMSAAKKYQPKKFKHSILNLAINR